MLCHTDTHTVRAKISPKQATKLATNNLAAILDDPKGACCYHCLERPIITQTTKTCDKTTVLCPLCGIDTVVPASFVPGPINGTLKQWHSYWFNSYVIEIEDEYEEVEEVEEVEDVEPAVVEPFSLNMMNKTDFPGLH